MMKIYQAVHDFEPEDEHAIRSQILWYNKRIGANNTTISWQNWERKGVTTIRDICHPSEGRLMSHQELQAKHGINCSFLQALTMRLHIPSEWRNKLTNEWQPHLQQEPPTSVRIWGESLKDISSLSAKQMYQSLMKQPRADCAAFNKWTIGIPDHTEWQEICTPNFSSTQETKLQSLQYKLLHRIVPCGVHLKQLRIRETDECQMCKQKDSIVHFFFHRRTVQFSGDKCPHGSGIR